MSIREIYRRIWTTSGPRTYSASADAARRATRARDHLERKRDQERRRRARERNQAERPKLRSPIRGIVSILVFAVAITTGVEFGQPLLNELLFSHSSRLDRVDVQGASKLTPEAIVRAAGLDISESLETIDPRAIASAVEAEPWIESARALRLPTGGLVISVVERDAVARWRLDALGETLLVDKHGERFEGALEPGGALPLVSGIGVESRTGLPDDALEILGALERYASLTRDPSSLTLFLPDIRLQPADIQTDGQSGYVLQLGEQGPRALLGRRLFPERVARLAALIENGEPTFLAARIIDLRYADRAVLQTEPVSG